MQKDCLSEETFRNVDLHAVLAKAAKEADMTDGDHPLYVDESNETIKCH